jgi:hypothetical protein
MAAITLHRTDVIEEESPETLFFRTPSLEDYLLLRAGIPLPELSRYIDYMRKTIGIGKDELFLRSSISSSYGHEIIKGTKHPTRNKILQFAFGMGINLAETQKLLWLSRHAVLDDSFEWDAVVMEAIEKRLSVTSTNILLSEIGLPLLFMFK